MLTGMLSRALALAGIAGTVARAGLEVVGRGLVDVVKEAAEPQLTDLEREVAELRQRVAELEGRLAVAETARAPRARSAKRTAAKGATPATVADKAAVTKPAESP